MKKTQLLVILMALFAFSSCKEDDAVIVPVPEFTIADEFYTTMESVNIKDVSEADAYHWDLGNGAISTNRVPDSFRYTKPGNYTIKLTTYNSGHASTVEKVVRVAQLYAYEVQLRSYIENYALEGGDLSAPSEGNPDVYLQVSTYADNAEQVIYKSDTQYSVSKEKLPLTFAVNRGLIGNDYWINSYPLLKFFAQNDDKPDRLIAQNSISGGSSVFHFDKATKEGYYSHTFGNDDWGSHVVVKFKAELP